MARLRDFSDIYTAVCEELKVPVSDTATLSRIKRDINIMYIDEIVPFKRWNWLTGNTKVVHKVYYGSGTCAITNNATAVTLSVTPSAGLGSFLNYYFSVDGFDEIYEISAHTSATTAVTLSSAYQGATVTAGAYKIWTDRVTLPTDLRETVECYHQRSRTTMTGLGRQEFRRVVNESRKTDDFPTYFNVGEYYGTGEATRTRIMRLHPSITTQPVTIDIDYVKEVTEMIDDGDEPIMPIEDRAVLLYGALARGWGRERNEERAAYNMQLYQAKLGRMAGKIEEGFDAPKITMNNRYMQSKRGSRLRGVGTRGLDDFGGASSYTPPSYLEGVTINGATITGNVTVNSGITIDGRDISADGSVLDALSATATPTSVTLTDNTSSASNVATWSASTYDSIFISYSIKRGATIKEAGTIMLVTDGTSGGIAQAGAAIGATGVTFTADYSAGSLRLRYTTTSSGTDATMKYTATKWLA